MEHIKRSSSIFWMQSMFITKLEKKIYRVIIMEDRNMNTFEKTQKNIIEEMANSDQSATQLEEKKDENSCGAVRSYGRKLL